MVVVQNFGNFEHCLGDKILSEITFDIFFKNIEAISYIYELFQKILQIRKGKVQKKVLPLLM